MYIDVKHIGKGAECPKTLEHCNIYDHAPERSWRHLDTMQYKTYIRCCLPRVKNKQGEVVTICAPWAAKSERHTYLFEHAVIDVLQATKNQSKTAKLMRCGFNVINRIMHLSVQRGMSNRPEEVVYTNLSIDEKSYSKGHQYISVVSCPLSGCVIDVCEGRDKASSQQLIEKVISPKHRDKVETISMDMWEAYINVAKETLPNTKIVHDRFHLVKYLNDAIDKVRRREVKTHEELKHARFVLLKNKMNLTDKQHIIFEHIQQANYQVSKVWAIRENFKAIFGSKDTQEALGLFIKWGASVISSGINEAIKVAKTFNAHLNGVINALTHSFSNAMAERLNGKIQEVKVSSRGYRTFENFRSAILFFHGGLHLYPLNSQ